VTKYHVADFTPPMGLTATKPGSRRGGKGGDVAASGAKHVGLWEVDAVEGLWPGSALPSQAACYHVTDVGSLGPSTKPSQAYHVLHSVIQPSRTAAHAVAPQALAHAAAANEAVAAVSAFSGEECKACGAEGHKMADCPQAAPAKLNDGSRSSSSNRDRSGGSGSGSSGRSDKPSEASLMRRAIAAGQAAAARGERCSGCVVALDGRVVCEASNGVQAANGDLACTAPVLAVRELTGSGANSGGARVPLVAEHDRARCVVYCSEEPCAMGAGALLWGGVGRVVFAASGAQVQAAEAACRSGGNTLRHSSGSAAAAVSPTLAELLAHAPRPVAVQGGLLAQEALAAMRAATPAAAAAPSAEEVPATGRKRAAEGAPDNSSTTRDDACTVLERDGWTVRTYTFFTPLRIEATIGLRC
jgi:tRNA(Arg) A34 adenosine deaminase TadA